MCTVTVHRANDSLLVTMNRDEARDRAPEVPPVMHQDEITWVAPADSERGGTWMAVNELGVVACLMNKYSSAQGNALAPSVDQNTRGAIIPSLMVRGGSAAIRLALEQAFDPTAYAPFTLIVACGDGIDSYAWHGDGALDRTTHHDAWSLFTSSSWNTAEVIEWRARAFRDWVESGCAMRGDIPELHLLAPDGMREWSPLMDRDRTCTRSITQIGLLGDGLDAIVRYWPRTAINAGREPRVDSLPLRVARKTMHHV